MDRFDLYGALYLFCTQYHTGQWSRGYRILSRLTIAGYKPSIGLQYGRLESDEQKRIYRKLVRKYANKV